VIWLVYQVTISKRALARHRAWAMRHRITARLRPGPGFATVAELWFHWSKLAALSHGHRARPGLRLWDRLISPATDYAVRFGRAQYGRRAYGRMQDQVLILAPPQSGKSGMLADRIIDHPGPVVCTSTRADLFTNTAGLRSRRGPVATFNPLGVGGVPSSFGWNIIDGCADADTAIRRAQDLTGDYPDRRHEVVAVQGQRGPGGALAGRRAAAGRDDPGRARLGAPDRRQDGRGHPGHQPGG
jgi:hypothetical protein